MLANINFIRRFTVIQRVVYSTILQVIILSALLCSAFYALFQLEHQNRQLGQQVLPLATGASNSERSILQLDQRLRHAINSHNSKQFSQRLNAFLLTESIAKQSLQQLQSLSQSEPQLAAAVEPLLTQTQHASEQMQLLLRLVETKLKLSASINDSLGYLLYSIGAARDEMTRLVPLLFADIVDADMAYNSFIADAASVMTAQMFLMSTNNVDQAQQQIKQLTLLVSRMEFQYQALLRANPELAQFPSLLMPLETLSTAIKGDGSFQQQLQRVELDTTIASQRDTMTPLLDQISTDIATVVQLAEQQIKQTEQHTAAKIDSSMQQLLLLAGLCILLLVAMLVNLLATLKRSLTTLTCGIKAIAHGDFSQQIDTNLPAEFARLATWLNQASTSNRNLMASLRQGGRELDQAATVSSQITELQRQQLNNQSTKTTQIAIAVQQLNCSMQSIIDDCAATVAQNQLNADLIEQGQSALSHTSTHFESLSHHLNENQLCMDQLEQQVMEIGAVAEVITSIAQRTNLLALNAAIEAARAGTQGRGFAVVAAEVRELAKQTGLQTDSIETMLAGLHQAASKARNSTTVCRQEMDKTTQLRQHLADANQQIHNSIDEVKNRTETIATATQIQTEHCHQINQNITHLAEQSSQRQQQLDELSVQSNQVAAIATEQRQKLRNFVV
ncbi:methyl-accepting chemotaxis protein [Ferrimonas lipolytica]|uniref:Methyl-accepting chemotaxis protein n=1 Tax=Ferrimonas lipolytica TaxID=2724191 RepID=A0A6H1UFT5_9GAMM|nr:methyl-accepting chemotaxis protein [Ferrimonas lipolytica]QIZ77967.1 methyl-accepting chemotaxis protein [Ferrimonas lipolytica]